ncbi:phospholipase D family protein [Pseudorhodoferax sp.]|uniref:phospholipase D family protein n=1 Tax=Pseudorhodoferax sp. TaxID=1993553 RepID=UPI002DD62A60|nr:phospholipase D family protein [Pseudorhodoferax sp.]
MNANLSSWRFVALWLCAAWLVGCTALPPKQPDDALPSLAIAAGSDTALGRIALKSIPEPELSGFRLLPLGSYSLDARLTLAERAQKTLDVQYYHIQNDETGRLLMRALRDAAARGVRVRLLLDDWYTSGEDELLLALASHPNVELRLFNPFCCARGAGQLARFALSFGDWNRVNHRMHNKLMVADGAMAVIGGRNVANEYYLRGALDNFIDLDAFVVGAVVADLSRIFDGYWNSDPVYPLQRVAHTYTPRAALQKYFDEITGPEMTRLPAELPPNDVLGYGPIREDLDAGQVGLIWGTAIALADTPNKVMEAKGMLLMNSVTYNVLDAMRMAQQEVVVSSPYLVPGKPGMVWLREMAARGIKLQVLTNSLASTDEPAVHIGYSQYRPEMLRLGIDLYELSSSRVMTNKRQSMLFGKSMARLHAKLVVIDRKTLFIGSMNLDPRSARINTEMGLIIQSPQLARELLRVIDIDKLQSAYRVRLAANGSCCEWLTFEEDMSGEMILTTEPDSSFTLRLKTWLLSPFVPEQLL